MNFKNIYTLEINALNKFIDMPQTPMTPMEPEPMEPEQPEEYLIVDGVAIIGIIGALSKYPSQLQEIFGGASYIDIAQKIQNARDNTKVSSLLLFIDSPGGEAAGVCDLGELIYNFKKPTAAYCSDTCCSGAYWLASQCKYISANPSAFVGSIGVYAVVADTSKAYEKAGVAVKVIKAGEFKGGLVDGVQITDPEIANLQREVDSINTLFITAIATGRGISTTKAQTLADGRAWIASDAKNLGMVDAVENINTTLLRISMGKKIDTTKVITANIEQVKEPKVEAEAIVATTASVAMSETDMQAACQKACQDCIDTCDTCVSTCDQMGSTPPDATTAKMLDECIASCETCQVSCNKLAGTDSKAANKTSANKTYEAGTKDAQDRLEAVIKACGGSLELGYKEFLAGHDYSTAKANYSEVVIAERDELKAKVAQLEKMAGGNTPVIGILPAEASQNIEVKVETPTDVLKQKWEKNEDKVQEAFKKFEYFEAFARNASKLTNSKGE